MLAEIVKLLFFKMLLVLTGEIQLPCWLKLLVSNGGTFCLGSGFCAVCSQVSSTSNYFECFGCQIHSVTYTFTQVL